MHVQATQHDEVTPVRFHVSQYLRIVRENRRISKSRFHPCSYGRVFCKPDVISRNKPDKPMYLINSFLNIERLKLLFDPMLSISNIGNLLLPHRYLFPSKAQIINPIITQKTIAIRKGYRIVITVPQGSSISRHYPSVMSLDGYRWNDVR